MRGKMMKRRMLGVVSLLMLVLVVATQAADLPDGVVMQQVMQSIRGSAIRAAPPSHGPTSGA